MCLGQCLAKGSCERDLQGEVEISHDGLALRHRAINKNEWRTHFKGDANWSKNGRLLIEYHNADKLIIAYLHLKGKRTHYRLIADYLRKSLRNPRIYNTWVYSRLRSLFRHGFIRGQESYTLTPQGLELFKQSLFMQLAACFYW